MYKKLIAVLLIFILAFGMVACGKTTEEAQTPAGDNGGAVAEKPTYKIGIMTGTVSQNEEEYRMAENMQAKYGSDMIVISTYPDKFMQEQETTITNMMAMASDPNLKAIVMVQAVPGAAAAVDKVREVRPDMLFVLGSPQEDQDVIATKGDIVLNTDDLARGEQIAQHAFDMGAKTLVHYSFPRHMSIEFLAVRRDLMKAKALELGMAFIETDAPDPTGDAGVPGAQQFISEDVPRKIAEYGKDTAVFATNCSMMEPLIRQTILNGGIFPVQCCPSPYHAMPAALGIAVPDDKKGDIDYIITEITAKVAEMGATGRVATWPLPVNMLFVQAGTEYAIEFLEGRTTGKVDKNVLIQVLEKAAGMKVQITEYGNTDNYFLFLSDHIIF